jgi:hypothetical protein
LLSEDLAPVVLASDWVDPGGDRFLEELAVPGRGRVPASQAASLAVRRDINLFSHNSACFLKQRSE